MDRLSNVGGIMMPATSYNSWYAVRYCSLKPLRASHTRQPLYAMPKKIMKQEV